MSFRSRIKGAGEFVVPCDLSGHSMLQGVPRRSNVSNAGAQEKFQSRSAARCGRRTTGVPDSNNFSGAKLGDRLVIVTVFFQDFIGVFALFWRRMHHAARSSAELDGLIDDFDVAQ
jgi:hypothetical protein